MAETTDNHKLIVSLEARINSYEKALQRAQGQTNTRMKGIEAALQRPQRALEQTGQSVNRVLRKMETDAARSSQAIGTSFKAIGASLAAGISLQAAEKFIDSAIRIQNALKVAGTQGAQLTKVYDALFASAQRNAAPLESLAVLYGRAAQQQKELGVSTEQLLKFTDDVAVALRVTGTSAEGAQGALLQLGQLLGSGTVNAEEFNSVLEGVPTIAQAAARGIKEAGGSVAALKKLVVDGKVSSKAFFDGFQAGAVTLADQVATSETTISGGFVRLQNVLIDVAKQFNQNADAAGLMNNFLDDLGAGIRELGAALSAVAPLFKEFGDYLNWINEGATNFGKTIGEMTGALKIGDALRGMFAGGVDLDPTQAKLEELQKTVTALQDAIKFNTEMGIDTTTVQSQLNQVLAKIAAIKNGSANIPSGAPAAVPRYQPGTPGDPNALASQSTLPTTLVKPVTLADYPVNGTAKATKSATKDLEKFADKLAELKQTGAAAGLREIDRQVVQFATSLKNGSKMMAQYIAAVKSGDLSKAPAQLLQARKAFVEIAAANQAADIIQKYGTGAQVTSQFAEQQEILNAAVANGSITAGQAKTAYADFLSQFGQYQWIEQVTDAFSSFADSVIDDFDNIEDAANSLVKNLAKILINATLIQPFEDWLKGALGQAVNTANAGGSSGSIVGSLFSSAASAAAKAATQAASAPITGTSISNMAKAIQMIESGGNYQALGPVTSSGDRAYGAYQVMGANIPSWTQMATGTSLTPSQFLNNPGAQDAVFNKVFGANAARYGSSDAASIWFSGRPLADAASRSDQLGTTTQAYVDQFNANLKKLGDTASDATGGISSLADTTVKASQSIVNRINLAEPDFAAKADPNGFANMLGITPGTGSLSTGGGIFGNLFQSIGSFIQNLVSGLGNVVSGLFSGGGGLLSGIFSMFGFAGGTRNASPGWHWVGENGPELLKFAGGEKVAPLGKLQSYGMTGSNAARLGNSGGGKLKIEFQDNVGVQRRVERSSGPDGDTLRVMIDQQIDRSIGSGRFDKSFAGRYGARPTITKRG